MRLPIQPRREVVWTVEWDLELYGQRQAWQIVIEERFGTHGEHLIGKKSYKVFALSSPMGVPNTPRYFPTMAQARKHAVTLLGIYGGFLTRPEWTPGAFMNSRWCSPDWREKWHRTMISKDPNSGAAYDDSMPLLLTA